MADEAFLINPPKRMRKRKKSGHKRRRRNALGETLTVVGGNPMDKNPWYGERRAHRIAALMRWGKYPMGRIPRRYRSKVGRRRKRRKVSRVRRVPMMVTGFGLGRRRVPLGRRFNNMARRNYWLDSPIRHRRAAKKGWRRRRRRSGARRRYYRVRRRRIRRHRRNAPMVAQTNVRRRRRRRSYRRRSYRRYRRNPNGAIRVGMRGVWDIMNWAPYAVTGGLSVASAGVLPGMIAPNWIVQPTTGPFWKYGIQLASVFGGGLVVDMMVRDKRHVNAWLIAGTGYIAYELLRDWVFKPFFPVFAAQLGAYEGYYSPYEPYQQVGAYDTAYGMQAFPEEVSAFPEEVGAYPYNGSYGY